VARRSGDNVAVQISADGVTGWASLGCFQGFQISKTRARYDATCGGDANKVYVVGKPDFTGSAPFVWDDADDAIFDAADETDPVYLRLIPDLVNAPTKYYQGQFYLDLNLNVAADTVKGTVNISAAGSIVWS
jgi:hypothetical protein